MQSIPTLGFFNSIYLVFASATLSIGFNPEFSDKTVGIYSKAAANALIAYYSTPAFSSATSYKAKEQANSTEPPPYTILLVLIKFLTTQRAS